MVVSTLLPSWIAATLAPLPRCSTISRSRAATGSITDNAEQMYSYDSPWKPKRSKAGNGCTRSLMRTLRGSACIFATFGIVRWNAVSKHATCGTDGNARVTHSIPVSACGM